MLKSFKIISFVIPFFLISSFNCFAYSEKNTEQQNVPSNQEKIGDKKSDFDVALHAAINAGIYGPETVTIINQGKLNLPDDYVFIPKKEAADFMRVNGNRTNQDFVGLIVNVNDELRWFISIDFIDSGYVRDTEAKSWNADDLLSSLKNGTEEGNKERVKNGFPPLKIIGWIEQPNYNSSVHQLVWAMLANGSDSSDPLVNYNTYALGRDGYLEFNLITSKSAISKDKLHVNKILNSFHYTQGKRYEDFSESTDRVAEFGLAALITGVAAKKLGLLALAGAFFIKMWKILLIVPVILGSKIKNLFGRN